MVETEKKEDEEDGDDAKPRILISLASEDHKLVTTTEAASVRPHLLCCIVSGLELSGEGVVKKFLQIQNKLHDQEGACNKRQAATIATHDLSAVTFPLRYSALEPELLVIQPLRASAESTGRDLVAKLNEEAEAQRKKEKRSTYSGIHKYLYLLKNLAQYPVLLDAQERALSFPPITNAELTRMGPETTAVVVEVSSGESQAVCRKVLALLLAQMLAAGLSATHNSLRVQQVKITKEDGSVHATFPDKNDLKDLDGVVVTRDWL